MLINKSRIHKLKSRWKPLGLQDKMVYGKYKNCRIGFIINIDAKYLEYTIKEHNLQINKQARAELKSKLEWLGWTDYLLK